MALANKAPRLEWSQRDEEMLQSMIERKAAFKEKFEGALRTYICDTYPFNAMKDRSQEGIAIGIAAWMVGDPGKIRDLLEPFDSGVRPPGQADAPIRTD